MFELAQRAMYSCACVCAYTYGSRSLPVVAERLLLYPTAFDNCITQNLLLLLSPHSELSF